MCLMPKIVKTDICCLSSLVGRREREKKKISSKKQSALHSSRWMSDSLFVPKRGENAFVLAAAATAVTAPVFGWPRQDEQSFFDVSRLRLEKAVLCDQSNHKTRYWQVEKQPGWRAFYSVWVAPSLFSHQTPPPCSLCVLVVRWLSVLDRVSREGANTHLADSWFFLAQPSGRVEQGDVLLALIEGTVLCIAAVLLY